MKGSSKVRPCLWFDGDAEVAVRFYVSLLPDSRIESIYRREPDTPPVVLDFTLAGTPYQALNGGPQYPQTPAHSISVVTEDQHETDRLWSALAAGGKEIFACWLTDRWGVAWQIAPRALIDGLMSEDRAAAERVFQAMHTMVKIDIARIEAARRGDWQPEEIVPRAGNRPRENGNRPTAG